MALSPPTDQDVTVLKATPHKYGPGKTHIFDGGKTFCGRTLATCPGRLGAGHLDNVDCQLCIKSWTAQWISRQRAREWAERDAQWRRERAAQAEQDASGIPTTHRATRFRSRLEARWAAFFDMIGWRWEYEPFDLDGYIPDFLVFGARAFLIEVKPFSAFEEAARVAKDAPISDGDTHPLLVVGINPELPVVDIYRWALRDGVAAGAITQWCGDDEDEDDGTHVVAPAAWARCRKCQHPGVYHVEQGWILHPCGHYDGDGFLGHLPDGFLERAWAGARNRTQWKP